MNRQTLETEASHTPLGLEKVIFQRLIETPEILGLKFETLKQKVMVSEHD